MNELASREGLDWRPARDGATDLCGLRSCPPFLVKAEQFAPVCLCERERESACCILSGMLTSIAAPFALHPPPDEPAWRTLRTCQLRCEVSNLIRTAQVRGVSTWTGSCRGSSVWCRTRHELFATVEAGVVCASGTTRVVRSPTSSAQNVTPNPSPLTPNPY